MRLRIECVGWEQLHEILSTLAGHEQTLKVLVSEHEELVIIRTSGLVASEVRLEAATEPRTRRPAKQAAAPLPQTAEPARTADGGWVPSGIAPTTVDEEKLRRAAGDAYDTASEIRR